MGWLEELKGQVEYTMDMDSFMDCVEISILDRLIAIVEEARKLTESMIAPQASMSRLRELIEGEELCDYGHSDCKYTRMASGIKIMVHGKACPYHEDWKP